MQKKPGAGVTREELLSFYQDKVAKWWIPDDVVFVEALPHTATGKLLKTKLRDDFQRHKLPGRAERRSGGRARKQHDAADRLALHQEPHALGIAR